MATDQARSDFWNSRWNTSKDPLGPLAVDVVRNAYLLGCLANERVLNFAAALDINVNLTSIGVDIMRAHRVTTDEDTIGLLGKLSATQVASYHFTEFGRIGLPSRTFGGSPLTGTTREAERTKFIWCPSCE